MKNDPLQNDETCPSIIMRSYDEYSGRTVMTACPDAILKTL